MFGYLEGKLISKSPETNACVIRAFRVGFEVLVPRATFDPLLVGQKVALWLHTHVREDALTLFGFHSEDEKNLFRLLLSVSGLGPKTAMNLISEHGAHRLVELILHKATSDITKASGVGKKLAEKLPMELSAKLEKWVWREKLEMASVPRASAVQLTKEGQLRLDLTSALLNLGYLPNQVKVVLDKLLEREDLEDQAFEFCLRAALRDMSGRPIIDRNG